MWTCFISVIVFCMLLCFVSVVLVKIRQFQNCWSFIIQEVLCLAFAMDTAIIIEPATKCKT